MKKDQFLLIALHAVVYLLFTVQGSSIVHARVHYSSQQILHKAVPCIYVTQHDGHNLSAPTV